MADENRYAFLNQKSQPGLLPEVLLGVTSVYVHDICQRIEGFQKKIENLDKTSTFLSANPSVNSPGKAEHNKAAISTLETCISVLTEQVPEEANHLSSPRR